MSCIGNDCFIVKQEARNPVLKLTYLGECGPDVVDKLKQTANRTAIARNSLTRDTCSTGCLCAPKKGAQTEETDWDVVPIEPFVLTDENGKCAVRVEGTIETRILRTPGLCKKDTRPTLNLTAPGAPGAGLIHEAVPLR